jgi:hypothetical protein
MSEEEQQFEKCGEIRLVDRNGKTNPIRQGKCGAGGGRGKCGSCSSEDLETVKILKQENIKFNVNTEIISAFTVTETTLAEEQIFEGKREEKVVTDTEFTLPDIGNDILMAGHMHPEDLVVDGKFKICCGSAHLASQTYNERDQIINEIHDFVPPPSLANPMPNGGSYTPADFTYETDDEPKQFNRFAVSIAQQINSLHPLVRCKYASGVKAYLENEFKNKPVGSRHDINITEGYRSPERSNKLRAAGIRAAAAGHSWHNYGLAADFAVYAQRPTTGTQWHYDDGRRGDREYTVRLRQYMAPYDLINDLSGDSGHFYVKEFGKGVPTSVRTKEIAVPDLFFQKGVSPCVDPLYDIEHEDAEENEREGEISTLQEMLDEVDETIIIIEDPAAYKVMNIGLAESLNKTTRENLQLIDDLQSNSYVNPNNSSINRAIDDVTQATDDGVQRITEQMNNDLMRDITQQAFDDAIQRMRDQNE